MILASQANMATTEQTWSLCVYDVYSYWIKSQSVWVRYHCLRFPCPSDLRIGGLGHDPKSILLLYFPILCIDIGQWFSGMILSLLQSVFGLFCPWEKSEKIVINSHRCIVEPTPCSPIGQFLYSIKYTYFSQRYHASVLFCRHNNVAALIKFVFNLLKVFFFFLQYRSPLCVMKVALQNYVEAIAYCPLVFAQVSLNLSCRNFAISSQGGLYQGERPWYPC